MFAGVKQLFSSMNTLHFAFHLSPYWWSENYLGLSWLLLSLIWTFKTSWNGTTKGLFFYSVNKTGNFSLLTKHVMYRLNKCYTKSLWSEVLQVKTYETEMILFEMISVKKKNQQRRIKAILYFYPNISDFII